VLHHTPNTPRAINEVNRVLKKEGKTVIMLYRKFCPKGIMVILVRFLSSIVDKITGEKFYIANRLRKKYQKNPTSPQGTALLELFGCPVLQAFSIREVRKMFQGFKILDISCVQPGFQRLADFTPLFRKNSIKRILEWLDEKTQNLFGFYIVIEAKK